MTINISQHILGLKGQRVNEIKLDDGGVKMDTSKNLSFRCIL